LGLVRAEAVPDLQRAPFNVPYRRELRELRVVGLQLLDVTGDSLDCRAIGRVSSSIALWRHALERAN
jgi:hypothetical protein